MPQEFREVFRALLIKENFQFARGLGMGLGLTFLQLDDEIQREKYMSLQLRALNLQLV
jgi:hypothetical protein